MNIRRTLKQYLRRIVVLVIAFCVIYSLNSMMAEGNGKGLSTRGKTFLLDGNPFLVLCGAIHYFRVTPDSWEDRIKKAKQMGLNSIDM